MPTSDNESYMESMEHSSSMHSDIRTMSKAELRRSNKPIMEKKRRARINHCLNELKSLILDAMKKDPARHSKLEKADILEMTVKHLQTVQRQQLAVAVATDPNVLYKFKTGFSECATEVSRYIGHLDGVDPAVRQRLLAHLSQCVTGLQQLTPFSFMGSSAQSPTTSTTFPPNPQVVPSGPNPVQQVPFPAGDVNNNHTRLMSGLQLIPSRLPSGELALVVPGNNNNNNNNSQPFFPPSSSNVPSATVTSGAIDRSHPSAFTAVKRSLSPLLSPVSSSSEDSSFSYPQSPPPVAFKAPVSKPEQRTQVKLELQTMAIPTPPFQTSISRQEHDKIIEVGATPSVAFKAPASRQETHVKLELKTMAVASSSSTSSFPGINSNVGNSFSIPTTSRHALDFSMKPPPPRKRPADSNERPQHEDKVQRFSFHVSTHREQVVPRVNVPARHPPACAGNDSMWRPW